MNTKRLIAAPIVVLAMTLAACGGSSEDITNDESLENITDETNLLDDGTDEATALVAVEDARAQNNPMEPENGIVYMTLTSPIDDAVIAADVDISLAAYTEVHESITNDDGSTGTQFVDRVELPADQPVSFGPEGYQIKLFGLIAPLVVGEIVSVTLTLESGELVFVDAEVREDSM